MGRALSILMSLVLMALSFFFALAGAEPKTEYFARTSMGLFLIIVFVVVCATAMTWLCMAIFGRLGDRLARQRFSRFLGWKFLRSQRITETVSSRFDRSMHRIQARPKWFKWTLLITGLLMCFAAWWIDAPTRWNLLADAISPAFVSVLQVSLVIEGTVHFLFGVGGLLDPTTKPEPAPEMHARNGVTLPTFISIVSVSIGLWALIVVLAVINGLQSDLRQKILRTNAHIVIEPKDPDGVLGDAIALEDAMRKLPGVLEADAYVRGDVMMSSSQSVAVNVVVKGMTEEALSKSEQLRDRIVAGSISSLGRPEWLVTDTWRFPFTGLDDEPPKPAPGMDDPDLDRLRGFSQPTDVYPTIIIGVELAASLGVDVGSELQLISPDGDVGPTGLRPKLSSFRVGGIFRTGMYEYDQKLAYVALDAAQRFFDYGRDRNVLEARVEAPESVTELVPQIESIFGSSPFSQGPGLAVSTFQERNKNLFSALAMERIVMFLILGFIILVASLLIVSSLVMLVVEKIRDIAVFKALGASSGQIGRGFVMIGTFIGLFGILAGIPLGIGTCVIIISQGLSLPDNFYLATLPVKLDALEITMFGLAALGICLLATLWPAVRAAELRPSEGLRHG